MKQNTRKIITGTAAATILLGVGWLANAFVGNPISRLLAQHTAETHLDEHYADTDYYIEKLSYNFKDGNYHAFIESPTSIDTQFSFYITMGGKLRLDTYDSVLDGFNTARRLEMEYRALADTILADPSFPYQCHIDYGTLEIYPEELLDNPQYEDIPAYALNQNDLILDKRYDIRELGRQSGHLILYIDSDTVTPERAAEIMLDIKTRFDEAEIPFAAMDFTLQHPRLEDGKRPDGSIRVYHFLYHDIHAEGMVDRVAAADKERRKLDEIQDTVK